MSKTYSCSTLEECLEKASNDLNIPKESLDYNVIEESKGFFKKSCTISINYEKKLEEENDLIDQEFKEKDFSGKVSIKNGNIIVKNPIDGGQAAIIRTSKNIRLIVDGNEANTYADVFEHSKIEINFDEKKAERKMNIRKSDDNMEAYIDITYDPEIIYTLKNCDEASTITLDTEVKEKKYPPKFQKQEILEELKKCGIIFGLIMESIDRCIEESNVHNILVAKGVPTQDAEDDVLELKYEMDNDLKKLSEDYKGKVDFKSIGSINSVFKDDVIAILRKGKDGCDGQDILGKVKKHKSGKKINLIAGQGCILKDDNTVIAALQGKPCLKNSTLCVYQLHEVSRDVDLTTGNISFVGDVLINGSVKEGMKVQAGNGVNIKGDVERAEINAKGDINIQGNIIFSDVIAGGQDTEKLNFLKALESLNILLQALADNVEEVKKFNLLGYGKTDGQIIKVLIDTKFKTLTKVCMSLIAQSVIVNRYEGNRDDRLSAIVKNNLLGLGPLKIKHYSELFRIQDLLKEKIETYKSTLVLPVNIKIGYCQDSTIKSSGNIMVSGKGVYVSRMEAHQSVYFMTENSVVRGGTLRASEEIKCKIVGSQAGVTTKLVVDEGGHIWVDIAYPNTILGVGMKEHTIEEPSRNIHAYINSSGDLIVEKLKL